MIKLLVLISVNHCLISMFIVTIGYDNIVLTNVINRNYPLMQSSGN